MSGKLRIQIYLKKDEFEAIRQKAAQVRLPMSAICPEPLPGL